MPVIWYFELGLMNISITETYDMRICSFCNFTFPVSKLSFPYSDTVLAPKTQSPKGNQNRRPPTTQFFPHQKIRCNWRSFVYIFQHLICGFPRFGSVFFGFSLAFPRLVDFFDIFRVICNFSCLVWALRKFPMVFNWHFLVSQF